MFVWHLIAILNKRTLERHLKYFGLVDDGGKAITFLEWATLAQDRAGWLKLVTKAPFNIGKPQLRPPRTAPGPKPEPGHSSTNRWSGSGQVRSPPLS